MFAARFIGGLTLGLLAGLSSVAAAQNAPASPAPGVYTVEQGARGEEVYRKECSRCHSTKDHSSPDFRQSWNGQSVRALFDYLRFTMPDDDPAALNEQQYLDVTAYLLKLNGMPSGESALVADTTALKKLVIDIKAPGSADRSGEPLRRLFRSTR
jgi:mono/diheme cytochrome c family protein